MLHTSFLTGQAKITTTEFFDGTNKNLLYPVYPVHPVKKYLTTKEHEENLFPYGYFSPITNEMIAQSLVRENHPILKPQFL